VLYIFPVEVRLSILCFACRKRKDKHVKAATSFAERSFGTLSVAFVVLATCCEPTVTATCQPAKSFCIAVFACSLEDVAAASEIDSKSWHVS